MGIVTLHFQLCKSTNSIFMLLRIIHYSLIIITIFSYDYSYIIHKSCFSRTFVLHKRTFWVYNQGCYSAGNVSNGKDQAMDTSLQTYLDKLLNVYSHSYDIFRDVEVESGSFPAAAFYYLRDENYLISRKHVLSAVEQHEYLYFFLTDHLDEGTLQKQIELSKNAGLSQVKPHKDHMFSNVGLVILANTISPEAKKLIKRTRFRKNYKLSFHGWTEYQLAAMETSTNCFFSNPAGKEARKNLEQNFASKTGKRK